MFDEFLGGSTDDTGKFQGMLAKRVLSQFLNKIVPLKLKDEGKDEDFSVLLLLCLYSSFFDRTNIWVPKNECTGVGWTF